MIPSELLADNFRFTDSDGEVKSKPDFLSAPFTPYSGLIHDNDVEVHLRGDSAIVTGTLVKKGDSGEKHYG